MQQLEKAELEKYELQRRLKASENGGTYAAQKVCAPLGLTLTCFPFLPYYATVGVVVKCHSILRSLDFSQFAMMFLLRWCASP